MSSQHSTSSSPPPVNVLVPPRPLPLVDTRRDSEARHQIDMEQDELMDVEDRSDQQEGVNTTSGQQQQQPNGSLAIASESRKLIASMDTSAGASLDPGRAAADSAEPSADGLAPRKRKRLTRACDSCRRRKIKCDGLSGCGPCRAQAVECTYNDVMRKRGPRNGRKSGSVAAESVTEAAAPPTPSQPSSVASPAPGPAQHAVQPITIAQQFRDDHQGPPLPASAYTHPHPPVPYSYHPPGQQTYQHRPHHDHQAIAHASLDQKAHYSSADLPEYHHHAHRQAHASSIHPIPFPVASNGVSRAHACDYERTVLPHYDLRSHPQGHFASAHPQFGPGPSDHALFPAAAAALPAQEASHEAYHGHSPKYHGPPALYAEPYRNDDNAVYTSPSRSRYPPKPNGISGPESSGGCDRQPTFGSVQQPLRLDLIRFALHHYAASDLSALDPPSLRSWALSRPLNSAQVSSRHPAATLGLAIAAYMCRTEGNHFFASTRSTPASSSEVAEWIGLASGTALTDMPVCQEAVLTLLLSARAELLVGNIVSAWRLVCGAWTSVELLRECGVMEMQRTRKRSVSGSPIDHQSLGSTEATMSKFPLNELVLAVVVMRLLVATMLGTSVSVDMSSVLTSGTPLSPHDSIRASQRDLSLAISRAVQHVNSSNPKSSVRSLVADIERCITARPEQLVFPPADSTLLVSSTAFDVQAHAALIMVARPAVLSILNLHPSSPSHNATHLAHGDIPTPRSPGEFDILFSAMSRSTGALVRVAQWISAQPAVHDARLRHALTVLAPILADAMYQAATGVAMIVASSAQQQQTGHLDSNELPHHQSAARSLVCALEAVVSASSAHASGSSSIVDRYLGPVAQLSARLCDVLAGSPLPTEFLLPLNSSDPMSSPVRATNSTMGLPIRPAFRAPHAVTHAPDSRQPHPLNGNGAPVPMDMDRSWRMHGSAPGRLSETLVHDALPLPISDSPAHSASSAPRLSQPLVHSPPESHRPMLPPISSLLPKPDHAPVNGAVACEASIARSHASASRSPSTSATQLSTNVVSPNGRQAESPGLAMLRMAAATMSDSGFDVRSAAATGGSASGEC